MVIYVPEISYLKDFKAVSKRLSIVIYVSEIPYLKDIFKFT